MRLRSGACPSIMLCLLSACQGLPFASPAPTVVMSPSASAAILVTPHTVPTSSIEPEAPEPGTGPSTGCYYSWATRDLPILGAQLQMLLAESGRNVQASAYAFGEECRSDSAPTTFLAMETDFRIRVPVDSIKNEESMGSALRAVMAAIEALPDEQIAGTRPGRADFEFAAGTSESLRLNVDIGRFRQEAIGLEGAALFRYFKALP